MRWVRNVVAGALSGVGVIVLLQQYAVLYPTGTVTVIGVVVGIAVQVALGLLGAARPSPAAVPTTAPVFAPAVAVWTPTHRVVEGGLDAWAQPDPSVPAIAHLAAGVDVRVEEATSGWARISADNGWTAWVDERRLASL